MRYEYDAWGNCTPKYLTSNNEYAKITSDYTYNDTTIINRFIAFKNPFRYRSYYYDFETNLYYLNSRYYDPEIGRFINADDIANLSNNFNGLNLYAYCLNNPSNYTDPNGTFLIALILTFLAITTIAGAVVGGVTAYQNGERGWDLVGKIFLGAAFGLAAGGAMVATTAVFIGAFGITSILGVSVLQIFAIGALAFDFTAFIVAPILGINMPGIEFETPNEYPNYIPPEYVYPSNLNTKYKINMEFLYDKILWKHYRR